VIFEESPLRDAYRLAIWGPYRQLIARLPHGWELSANRRLGRLVARASRGSRARIEANLARAFPQRDDLAELAARTFGTHFQHQYLPVSFPRMERDRLHRYVEIRGLEHVDRALASGRGVVLMHPHMGPVQLPLHGMGVLGYPVHQGGGVVTGLSRVGEWAAASRRELEASMPVTVHDGKGFLRPILRAISEGGVIMATCDGTGGGQELGRRLVRPVCGQPMKVPVSPVWLAIQAEAPLLTLRTHRGSGRRHRWVTDISAPLELPRGLPKRQALEQGADLVASFLTDSLTRYPEDWHFWDHFEPGRFLEPPPEDPP
jgi:lauroyl/myristoyl acyltransferase